MSASPVSVIVELIVTQAAQRRKGAPMTGTLAFHYPRIELAVRHQDGTSVSLFWTRETNMLAVEVVDHRNGDSFEFVLEPDERPLDAFYHPYAYAAARGLDLRSSVHEQPETVDV
jgi:hypothetical protein